MRHRAGEIPQEDRQFASAHQRCSIREGASHPSQTAMITASAVTKASPPGAEGGPVGPPGTLAAAGPDVGDEQQPRGRAPVHASQSIKAFRDLITRGTSPIIASQVSSRTGASTAQPEGL
jgi:hypothetical protein